MDAIKLLIDQHRKLEAQMKAAVDAQQPKARAASLAQVGDHLTKHITSEEEVFYPAVKAKGTVDVLLESLEEHLSLKRLLADLLTLDPAAETWEPKFKVLKEQTEHHHKEEEEHLFPKVLTLIDADEREALGREMADLQQQLRRAGDPR
ncbi:MAG TPA: hemerythrin domain-containing protein, partial [Steroidobacteraceae bacterium]|nr:hemerythrin domain-containing protein [Steroidobacteraceae bacterium]